MSGIMELYKDIMENKSHPITKDWFLISGPGPVTMIIVSYLYFSLSAGPRYMKDKKPYELRIPMIVYNFIQVLFSIYIFYEGLMAGWLYDYNYYCQPVDYTDNPLSRRMANAVHFYFTCKLIELLDTVFFVLRKKNRQISSLHVYHHALMPICGWIGCRFLPNGHDPRTQDYFLIKSPWGYLSIILFYLYFVYELGPNIMAKRKPFNLDKILQIYNLIQIVSCGYIFYKAMVLAWLNDYSFYCQPVDYSYDPRAIEITRMVWLYFLIKLFDLLDTVFFVLRKKQQQISFLHVYHHTGMTFGTWVCTKFLPGGHITLLGTINCFVHVVMYTYYLITSLQLSKPWWKKYVTQLQLTQFCVILVHFILLAWGEDCGFPKWTAGIMIPQNLFMIVLFGDFYYKAYIKKHKSSTNGVTTNEKLKNQ